MSVTPSAPPALYHYTGSSGLKGILESSSLWATDIEFLYDAQELQFGRSELCVALEAQAERIYPSNATSVGSPEYSRATTIHSAVQYLRQGNANEAVTSERVYATCFCAQSDLLSQWRGYSAGGGYAIGFRSKALLEIASLETEYT